MLKLLFRRGFPLKHIGQFKLYVFEIMLNDGSTCEAVVNTADSEGFLWRSVITMEVILADTVLGWRETYNCDRGRQDIDIYFRSPTSIVAKDYLSDAFVRHIERESCSTCREYYEAKLNPHIV